MTNVGLGTGSARTGDTFARWLLPFPFWRTMKGEVCIQKDRPALENFSGMHGERTWRAERERVLYMVWMVSYSILGSYPLLAVDLKKFS